MKDQKRTYRIKYLSGEITAPMTKQEAHQMMAVHPGELLNDQPGWEGCGPTIVGLIIIISALLTWLLV